MVNLEIFDVRARKTLARLSVPDGAIPRIGDHLELAYHDRVIVKGITWDFTREGAEEVDIFVRVKKSKL